MDSFHHLCILHMISRSAAEDSTLLPGHRLAPSVLPWRSDSQRNFWLFYSMKLPFFQAVLLYIRPTFVKYHFFLPQMQLFARAVCFFTALHSLLIYLGWKRAESSILPPLSW
jgi:hypothetical protein